MVPVEDAKAVLRDKIANQEFSAEDVERQAAERRRVKDAINAAQDAKATQRNVGIVVLSMFGYRAGRRCLKEERLATTYE